MTHDQASKAAAGAASVSTASAASAQGGGAASQLESIVQGLTGIDIGSLGLRDLPKLESRKKKNGTANAAVAAGGAAATGKAVCIDLESPSSNPFPSRDIPKLDIPTDLLQAKAAKGAAKASAAVAVDAAASTATPAVCIRLGK